VAPSNKMAEIGLKPPVRWAWREAICIKWRSAWGFGSNQIQRKMPASSLARSVLTRRRMDIKIVAPLFICVCLAACNPPKEKAQPQEGAAAKAPLSEAAA